MSRMISVDRLVHALSSEYMTGKKTLLQVIDEQPTAYDTNKVIEELTTAIDIVKGGVLDAYD